MQKSALLIIDMQQAYFNNGALERSKDALIESCNALIRGFVAAEQPVIIVRTEHEKDQSTWTLNMLDDEKGYLLKGDADTALVPGLTVDNTTELIKTRDSAFFKTDLSTRLHTLGVEHLYIAGVSTHSCVLLTAADAYANNFKVALITDAIASHDPSYHDSTLAMLSQEYRQLQITTAAALKNIGIE